jgi:ABC-type uncharacterized transport system fused permease/ATPase subunit
MNEKARTLQTETMSRYFDQTEKYVQLEQIIAAFPVVFSIPVLVVSMFRFNTIGIEGLGILVAVLPRTLQLFGNVHSVSILNSKLILMKTKYTNLLSYCSRLQRRTLQSQVLTSEIQVIDRAHDRSVDAQEWTAWIAKGVWPRGRYTVVGKNGAGKSTLLRQVKQAIPESIFLSPGVNLLGIQNTGSTGEFQLRQIEQILDEKSAVLLLDEWDAPLDSTKRSRLDSILKEASQSKVVIEVRHRTESS